MLDVVADMWDARSAVPSPGAWRCSELYAALRMNGGQAQLHGAAGEEAMRRGLLAVPVTASEPAPGGFVR
jgi:hypothetical protein